MESQEQDAIPTESKGELWTRPFHIRSGESKAEFLSRTHEIEALRRLCKDRVATEAEIYRMVALMVAEIEH
jgi:hypothetical protein